LVTYAIRYVDSALLEAKDLFELSHSSPFAAE
jgi:hypothetical protein